MSRIASGSKGDVRPQLRAISGGGRAKERSVEVLETFAVTYVPPGAGRSSASERMDAEEREYQWGARRFEGGGVCMRRARGDEEFGIAARVRRPAASQSGTTRKPSP